MTRATVHDAANAPTEPRWRWRGVGNLVASWVFAVVFTLLFVNSVGGMGLDKALPGSLAVATYLGIGPLLYELIRWRWRRWRLLIISNLAALAASTGALGLVGGWYTDLKPNSWLVVVSAAAALALFYSAVYALLWRMGRQRRRAEGWRW